MDDLFSFFFEEIGANTAQGALVIFGKLLAFVDETANSTNKLFHDISSNLFFWQLAQQPVKVRWQALTWPPELCSTAVFSSSGTLI